MSILETLENMRIADKPRVEAMKKKEQNKQEGKRERLGSVLTPKQQYLRTLGAGR